MLGGWGFKIFPTVGPFGFRIERESPPFPPSIVWEVVSVRDGGGMQSSDSSDL